MDLISFIDKYPRERDCVEYLSLLREKCSVCKKCGSNNYDWLEDSNVIVCKQCKAHHKIKTETVMENSILPIKHWFVTIFILTSSTNPISVYELQKRLRYPNDEPVSEILDYLNLLLNKIDGECTFETLLLACIQKSTL